MRGKDLNCREPKYARGKEVRSDSMHFFKKHLVKLLTSS
jgi:hypothetical protein